MSNADDLAAKVAQLEEKLAALEAKSKPEEPAKAELPTDRKPWPKYDPTEGMSMPPSALKKMVDVFPDPPKNQKFDPSAWARMKPAEPGGFGPPRTEPAKVPERGSGWATPPKETPRNFDLFDQMVASQVGGPNDTSKLKR
jgi:hypothetical protein